MINYGYVVADKSLCVLGDAMNPYTRCEVFGDTSRSLRFFYKCILTYFCGWVQIIFYFLDYFFNFGYS